VAPRIDDTLVDFPADCDWSPSRGPHGYSYHPTIESTLEALANTLPALTADQSIDPPDTPSTQDANMADPEVAPANAPTATPRSTAD